jgi:hypothetical protein
MIPCCPLLFATQCLSPPSLKPDIEREKKPDFDSLIEEREKKSSIEAG